MIHSFECPRASPDLAELFAALAEAQGAFDAPTKDKTGGSIEKYTYQYATMQSVRDAIREPLKENGLAISQWIDTFPEAPGEYVEVLVTRLTHKSGQWMAGVIVVESDQSGGKGPLQARGSGYTYLSRYAILAALGIAPEDDDGAKADKAHPPQEAPRAAPAKAERRRVPTTPPDFIERRPAPRRAPSEAPQSAESTTSRPQANDEEVAEAMAQPMLLRQRENILELALGRGMSLERLGKLIQEEGWCDEGLEGLSVEKASEFFNYLASNTDVR